MKTMIVESPNKVNKIKSILGDGWEVLASAGHIRDLPKKALGVDPKTFGLTYEFVPDQVVKDRTWSGGEARIKKMRPAIARSGKVYLATDPDREGEAIAWHLKEALDLREGNYTRVTFDAITESAIKGALEAARGIDDNLVKAQEARRALDRLVGWLVSPVISNALGMRLSAGRVQSPAVRLVVEREQQITGHKKIHHYGARVDFGGWSALWDTSRHVTKDQPWVLDKALAEQAAACRSFRLTDAKDETEKKAPPSPFSTALLLRAASVSLKFDPKQTTHLAQRLFEQGAVTYIRTDSVNLSDEATVEIRDYATAKGWGVPTQPRRFKSKADAQEAHEAIRPTHIEIENAGTTPDEKALYELIRLRTLASQLEDAVYQVRTVTLESKTDPKFTFRARARALASPGWTLLTVGDAVQEEEEDDEQGCGKIPNMEKGVDLEARSGEVQAKETKPPSRFTQAALIAKLEAEGIGRPSTYAAIMDNIMGKGYVATDKRCLIPTKIGTHVIDALKKAGFSFVDYDFTRALEKDLDLIADGKRDYFSVVSAFHARLQTEISHLEKSDLKALFPCPKCQAPLTRIQHDGKVFWGCSDRDCKTYLDDVGGKPTARKEHPCPKCKKPLKRYPKKDRDTGKPTKDFGWVCPDRECRTFLDDVGGKPIVTTIDCPSCRKPMHRRKLKSGTGYFWACSAYREGCKATMDDDRGKPVKPKPKKAAS